MRSIRCKKWIITFVLYCLFQLILNHGSVYVNATSDDCSRVPEQVTGIREIYMADSVKVVWNKPTTGLMCIKHYILEYLDHNNKWKTHEIDKVKTHYTLENVIICVRYDISITTIGTEFNSSKALTKAWIQPREDEWKVNNFKVKQNDKFIILSWSPVAYHEECYQGYYILVKNGRGDIIMTTHVPYNDFEYQVSIDKEVKLKPCTDYFFTLTVKGFKDTLTHNSTIKFTTSAVAPEQVTGISETYTVDSMKVVWNKPTTGLTCIKHYILEYLDHKNKLKSHEIDIKNNYYTIENLKTCVTYNISITSIGTEFNSSKAWITASPNPREDEWKVNNFNVKQTVKDVILSWSPVRYHEECKQSYHILVKNGRGEIIKAIDVPEKTFEYQISTDKEVKLKPCTDYFFTLTVKGSTDSLTHNSTIEFTVSASVPGAVESFVVNNIKSTEVMLNWTKPNKHQGCVTGYVLSWYNSVDNAIVKKIQLSSDKANYLISDLKACWKYNFSLSSVGNKGISNPVYKSITMKEEVPGAVESFVVDNIKSTEIILNWTKPNQHQECVTGYVLSWYSSVDNAIVETIQLSSDKANYLISDLKACWNYNISLSAVGNKGISEPVYKSITMKEEVPGAVESFDIDTMSTEVMLNWTKANKYQECVTAYILSLSNSVDNAIAKRIQLSSDKDNYLVSNLKPCRNYNISLSTVGNIGIGEPVYKSFYRKEEEGDWKVNNFNVRQSDDKDVILNWSPVVNHDECLQSYKILVNDSERFLIQEIDVPQKTFQYRMSTNKNVTLLPNTDYFFTLIVTGKTANLTDTSTKQFTTSAACTVQAFRITDNKGTELQLAWIKPIENVKCLTSYRLSWYTLPDDTLVKSEVIKNNETNYFTIKNIDKCKNYLFTIISYAGVIGTSHTKHLITTPQDYFEPLVGKTVQVEKTWALLEWQVRLPTNGRDLCPITLFEMNCNQVDGPKMSWNVTTTDNDSTGNVGIKASELKPSTFYFCSLKVTNRAGMSKTSEQVVPFKTLQAEYEESSYNDMYNCNTTYPTTMINMFRFFSFCIIDKT